MTKKNNKGVGNKKAWAKFMKLLPCAYCGVQPAGTIDHVIPVRDGGPTTPENCVPACEPCNQGRTVGVVRRPGSTWKLGEKLLEVL